MDDDVLRRGKPTCHVEFDEATALLAGDALQSFAFQLLAEHRLAPDPEVQLEMIRLFAAACGSRGMAGGQAIDLDAVGRNLTLAELEYMHILKTGALIRASILLGAHCGEKLAQAELERLDRYAKCIGLAFQGVDDILDEEGDARQDRRQGPRGGEAHVHEPHAGRRGEALRAGAARGCEGGARGLRRSRAPAHRDRGVHREARALECQVTWPPIPSSSRSTIRSACAAWSGGSSASWRGSCARSSSSRFRRPE